MGRSRVHLFEWEDQTWFPKLFRDFITDHLAFHVGRIYSPVVEKLATSMKETGYTRIVDLCSGAGGPLPTLIPMLSNALANPVTGILTDLYPNKEALSRIASQSNGLIEFRPEATDAMDCPTSLQGFRTIFTALHHFRPEGVKRILADSATKKVPFAAFDLYEPNPFKLGIMTLMIFFSAFILTPFVGRMGLGRFIWTYLIPLAPFFYAWDAAVSSLRAYSRWDLDELAKGLVDGQYQWETGLIPTKGIFDSEGIVYLIGKPSS